MDEKITLNTALCGFFMLAGHSYPFPFRGITGMHSELRKIRRFTTRAAVALDTGFPSHGAAVISPGIGWAVAV